MFLRWWERNHPVGAKAGAHVSVLNHRSVHEHSDWAEREWSRLEGLGKVQFFPVDSPFPLGLCAHPCALLLKERPNAPDDADDLDKYKARLICDLSRSRVNDLLSHWDDHYGTVGLAVSRMSSGSWLFVLDLADAF